MLIGQLVNGKAVDLPESTEGKYTLIGMSWSKKAQESFESWVNPAWSKFVAKTGMMDELYDINLYFVPMFVGTKKSAMDNVMKRMKAKSDPDFFPYVLFYKGDLKLYEEKLKLKDPAKTYLFLLDATGKIVHTTSGRYTENKMLEIEKIILEN
tara:strand:+ start:3140 stop:3598 length:459 start_codon:yes stop_codon:yes gene_type:complete